MAFAHEGRPVVFRPVDDSLRQRLIDLAEGDRHRIGAQRIDHRDIEVGGGHADLEPAQVLGRGDRAAHVVEAACAGIVDAQANQIVRFERGHDLVAHFAVDHAAHMRDRIEHKGQAEGQRHRLDRIERREIDPVEIDPAEAGNLERIGLAAELAAREHLDPQTPAGPFVEIAPHEFHRTHGRIVARMRISTGEQPGHDRLAGRKHRSASQRHTPRQQMATRQRRVCDTHLCSAPHNAFSHPAR